MNRHPIAPLALAVLAAMLAGCGQHDAAPGGTAAGSVRSESPDVAAETAGGFEPLSPDQRLQGTLEVDLGTGTRPYRVIARTISANLGEVAARHMASSEGQARLARANERAAGTVTVDAEQVQAFAQSMAGRTIYQAEMRRIDIIKLRQVSVNGSAADGSQVTLGLEFPLDGDALSGASLEYRPDRNDQWNTLGTRNGGGPVEVVIERFEAVDDSTYAVSGRFTARQLKPGPLAKKLEGQQIAEASGRFDIAEVRFRQ